MAPPCTSHFAKIHHNHKVSGDAAEAAAKLKVEMEERQTLAKWLVEEGLAEDAESEGGPPLLSPFAAPARALQLHTREFRKTAFTARRRRRPARGPCRWRG